MGAACATAAHYAVVPSAAEPEKQPSDRSIVENMMWRRASHTDIDAHYQLEAMIGAGATGSVARIRHKQTGRALALKTIQLRRISPDLKDELRNEISLLQELDHPNIIRPLEVFESPRQLYFVMELCSGGDLFQRQPYTEALAGRHVNRLLSAVAYLHARNIVHRDIKLENIMFESAAPDAEIKLIDFGFSRKFRPGGEAVLDSVGTLYAVAPEVISSDVLEWAWEPCDVWSAGVVAYCCLAGRFPFRAKHDRHVNDEAEMRRAILRARPEFDAAHGAWGDVSPAAIECVRSLLQRDPRARPTATAVLRSAWLQDEWSRESGLIDSTYGLLGIDSRPSTKSKRGVTAGVSCGGGGAITPLAEEPAGGGFDALDVKRASLDPALNDAKCDDGDDDDAVGATSEPVDNMANPAASADEPPDQPAARLRAPTLDSGNSSPFRKYTLDGAAVPPAIDDDGAVAIHTSAELIVESMRRFSTYGRLRQAALLVVAHRSTHGASAEVSALRRAFQAIDTTRDGTITMEELRAVLVAHGMADDGQLTEVFSALNLDRTGGISYTEFLAATVEAHGYVTEEKLADAFDRIDADDSGYISRDNLRELLGRDYEPAVVERMLAEAKGFTPARRKSRRRGRSDASDASGVGEGGGDDGDVSASDEGGNSPAARLPPNATINASGGTAGDGDSDGKIYFHEFLELLRSENNRARLESLSPGKPASRGVGLDGAPAAQQPDGDGEGSGGAGGEVGAGEREEDRRASREEDGRPGGWSGRRA